MESLLIHLLKSSALLTLFFIAYHFLLRKDTHFNKNRFFLMAGIFISLLLPFVQLTQTVVVESSFEAGEFLRTTATSSLTPREQKMEPWQIAGFAYLLISGILLSRMVFPVIHILRLTLMHLGQKEGKFLYIRTTAKTSPFSFFHVIVFNPEIHSEGELKMILEHEKVHSRQVHSVDQLIANIAVALLWSNPLSWCYRKGVEENLEYIADRETIKTMGNQKEYQYALLSVSLKNAFPGLLNHFHRSFIKSRIVMLEKGATSGNQGWKDFLILPFLVFFLFGFNTKEELVYADKGRILHSNPAMGQEPVFQIDSKTSNSYFRGIESFFRENHPDLQIAFTGITRDADLDLMGFQVETRFEGEDHFTKRMENHSKKKLKPNFVLQYSPGEKALIIKEQYEEDLQITITKEKLHVSHTEKPPK